MNTNGRFLGIAVSLKPCVLNTEPLLFAAESVAANSCPRNLSLGQNLSAATNRIGKHS